MANRHLSRSIVLQTLFERDFNGASVDVDEALQRNAVEFAPGMTDLDFSARLLAGILEKQPDLDTIIVKAAPDWPLEKISVVDRNVLRLGLYELLFADRAEVPAKVAINEAIELAKAFGGDSSGRFVNGVLGSVYKEIGEPGKDETSKKKKGKVNATEDLGGAVVYARQGEDLYLAFVHDVFGRWTLSKGRLEAGEDIRVGTMREIKEELGLDIVVKDDLGTNEYVASHPEKGKVRKRVHYFLAEAPFRELTLGSSGGLDDAKWFKLSEVVHLNTYDDILPVITKGVNLLVQTK